MANVGENVQVKARRNRLDRDVVLTKPNSKWNELFSFFGTTSFSNILILKISKKIVVDIY